MRLGGAASTYRATLRSGRAASASVRAAGPAREPLYGARRPAGFRWKPDHADADRTAAPVVTSAASRQGPAEVRSISLTS